MNTPAAADTRTALAVERTRLAHERTLMAWVRTATSLISFGFTIYKGSSTCVSTNRTSPTACSALATLLW